MLVTILDGQGEPHTVTWQGQDQINDYSSNLGAGAVGNAAAFQQVLPANVLRAGWLFQNTSPNAMLLCELNPAVAVSSFVVNSGKSFPPPDYPIPIGAIFVLGSQDSKQGDTFACREWVNAVGE